MYDLGDVVTLNTALTDPATGQAIDSTAVQVTVTLPDGTTTTLAGGSVGHPATGQYSASYTPTVTGLHRFNWTGTNPGFGESGTFMVWPALTVLGLDDAKNYLNIKGNGSDEELRSTIMAAVAAIEQRVGPLTPTQVTSRIRAGHDTGSASRYDGGSSYRATLCLPTTPVLTLSSATEVNAASADLSLAVMSAAGVVHAPRSTLIPGRFYDVTYIAGRARVPPELYQAVLELLRHLWVTQRGGASRGNPPQQQQASPMPGAAFAFPYRVEQLIQPHVQMTVG